ncbi:MAG: hypothetical protein HY906_16320, partial [Deltaproteobacteria bacterium]|nr:hypothetical protein [Deltaproteobacteria bacterium]
MSPTCLHRTRTLLALLVLASGGGCDGPASRTGRDGGADAAAGPDAGDPDGGAGGDAHLGPPDGGTGGDDAAAEAGSPTPADLGLVDWSHAGYPGDIPALAGPLIDVTDEGALCDGVTDDAPAIQAAIDGATAPAVVRLPARTCRIEAPLVLASGIVLRGAGSEATVLACRNGSGCLQIQGVVIGDYVALQSGLQQGSTHVEVASAAGFAVGQGAEIRQENIVPASADWGEYDVGQMVRVVAIQGSTLTVHPPLHLTYTLDKNPEARPVRFVEQVGLEDLTLRRIDSGTSDGASNVSMRWAADTWIRRVESDFTEKYHVAISESLHLEVRDSYFHDAKSKGDGGQGYGVSLARYATSILVENNVFYETRHAMIVQLGTSGCVFGYNYAERNYSDDGWDKTYISLHGHYAFMNLFESNVVGWVGVGDYWGAVGPGNAFFRNRLLGTDQHQGFGEYRGIELGEYHGTQYVIGN